MCCSVSLRGLAGDLRKVILDVAIGRMLCTLFVVGVGSEPAQVDILMLWMRAIYTTSCRASKGHKHGSDYGAFGCLCKY
jgi:hypothetical protein